VTEKKTTVEYRAESVLVSKTMWVGFLTTLLGILALPEVAGLIPPQYLPPTISIIGVLIMVLRKATVRPTALVMPGETKVVEVEKL